jgi:hypothetical protein
VLALALILLRGGAHVLYCITGGAECAIDDSDNGGGGGGGGGVLSQMWSVFTSVASTVSQSVTFFSFGDDDDDDDVGGGGGGGSGGGGSGGSGATGNSPPAAPSLRLAAPGRFNRAHRCFLFLLAIACLASFYFGFPYFASFWLPRRRHRRCG